MIIEDQIHKSTKPELKTKETKIANLFFLIAGFYVMLISDNAGVKKVENTLEACNGCDRNVQSPLKFENALV